MSVPHRRIPLDVETYRGRRIYSETDAHNIQRYVMPQTVYIVRDQTGIWNSVQAAHDHIDWQIECRERGRR